MTKLVKELVGEATTFRYKSDFSGSVLILVPKYEKLINRDGDVMVGVRVPFDDILRLTLDYVLREVRLGIEKLFYDKRKDLVYLPIDEKE